MAEPFSLELAGGLEWSIDPLAEPHGDAYVRTSRVSIRAAGREAHTIATFSDGPLNPPQRPCPDRRHRQAWEARIVLTLEPGEQLDRGARSGIGACQRSDRR